MENYGPFNLRHLINSQCLNFRVVQETIDRNAQIEFRPNTADDPHKRKPDISKAKSCLVGNQRCLLGKILPMMVQDFRQRIFGDNKEDSSSFSSA
ncbi:hypothetical protein HAX54_005832 [Datura stramonium]|uniref:Uncharacterized protein n=1 Tax=Datura stramonium TaxID=4076 RepID=A0ABS8TAL8_DATST|nr:hypothetical protein [Datura stramonium]